MILFAFICVRSVKRISLLLSKKSSFLNRWKMARISLKASYKSGMLLPQMYQIMQKTFSRVDPREMELSKKEISEILTERRRLNQSYREDLRGINSKLKQYMDLKKKLVAGGKDVLANDELKNFRDELLKDMENIDLQQ